MSSRRGTTVERHVYHARFVGASSPLSSVHCTHAGGGTCTVENIRTGARLERSFVTRFVFLGRVTVWKKTKRTKTVYCFADIFPVSATQRRILSVATHRHLSEYLVPTLLHLLFICMFLWNETSLRAFFKFYFSQSSGVKNRSFILCRSDLSFKRYSMTVSTMAVVRYTFEHKFERNNSGQVRNPKITTSTRRFWRETGVWKMCTIYFGRARARACTLIGLIAQRRHCVLPARRVVKRTDTRVRLRTIQRRLRTECWKCTDDRRFFPLVFVF